MQDESAPGLDDAVRDTCDAIASTFGPFGATKLVVQSDGTVSTTSSGRVTLDHLDVSDPAFTLLSRAAENVRDTHGDGSTAVVLLTGALLREAASLREKGVHPTTVTEGYAEGLRAATEASTDLERPVDAVGLAAVGDTAMTGVRDPGVRSHIAGRLASIATDIGDAFGQHSIRVITRIGGTPGDTELVDGVVLDERPAHESMPRNPDRDGVALLSETVDLPAADGGVTLERGGYETLTAIENAERSAFQQSLDNLVDAGVGFVATERAVNERVQALLGAHGILAIQRLDRPDLDALARATGATVVPDIEHCSTETIGLGNARLVRKAGRDHTVVETDGVDGPFTLFCRAPDHRSLDAFEHSVTAAISTIEAARRTGTVVPGGGAVEMHAARSVHDQAREVGDRRQLSINAFGDALTEIPRRLASSADIDALTAIARLGSAHAAGNAAHGVDVPLGEIRDLVTEDPVVLPAPLPPAIWQAATDLATQILRVDGRLSASDLGADDSETPAAD